MGNWKGRIVIDDKLVDVVINYIKSDPDTGRIGSWSGTGYCDKLISPGQYSTSIGEINVKLSVNSFSEHPFVFGLAGSGPPQGALKEHMYNS